MKTCRFSMKAYYNEIDEQASDWLCELMEAGAIMEGDIDTRSIVDVQPSDLAGYTRVHLFAGIGVWDYALQLAGFPQDLPVWTGSAPCQGFSVAGKKKGLNDERHLWPEMYRLISACRPELVFGEQVAAAGVIGSVTAHRRKDAGTAPAAWLDLVQDDLARAHYTLGACVATASGAGAPHIRQRLYWISHPVSAGRAERGPESGYGQATRSCETGGTANNTDAGCFGRRTSDAGLAGESSRQQPERLCDANGLVNNLSAGLEERHVQPSDRGPERSTIERTGGNASTFWDDAEWTYCQDGFYRPIEPMLEPLADGARRDLGFMRFEGQEEKGVIAPLIEKGKNRIMRLRGYGNAICAPLAAEFIKTCMEVL